MSPARGALPKHRHQSRKSQLSGVDVLTCTLPFCEYSEVCGTCSGLLLSCFVTLQPCTRCFWTFSSLPTVPCLPGSLCPFLLLFGGSLLFLKGLRQIFSFDHVDKSCVLNTGSRNEATNQLLPFLDPSSVFSPFLIERSLTWGKIQTPRAVVLRFVFGFL